MEFLTREEVASRLKVNIETVRCYERNGMPRLNFPNTILGRARGYAVRFVWEDVTAWILANSTQFRPKQRKTGKSNAEQKKPIAKICENCKHFNVEPGDPPCLTCLCDTKSPGFEPKND